MRGRLVAEVLSLPVRMHGIELGKPVEALVEPDADRVVGFELRCGDGAHRFLPYAVASIRDHEIDVASALALIDERELGFYRTHARKLSELALAEPWLDEHGGVHETRHAA